MESYACHAIGCGKKNLKGLIPFCPRHMKILNSILTEADEVTLTWRSQPKWGSPEWTKAVRYSQQLIKNKDDNANKQMEMFK